MIARRSSGSLSQICQNRYFCSTIIIFFYNKQSSLRSTVSEADSYRSSWDLAFWKTYQGEVYQISGSQEHKCVEFWEAYINPRLQTHELHTWSVYYCKPKLYVSSDVWESCEMDGWIDIHWISLLDGSQASQFLYWWFDQSEEGLYYSL